MRPQRITLKSRIFLLLLVLFAGISDIAVAKVSTLRQPEPSVTSVYRESNTGNPIAQSHPEVNHTSETQFSWISYVPAAAPVIALFAFLFALYVRSRRHSDNRGAEYDKRLAGDEHEKKQKEQQYKTDDERYRERLIEELGKNTIFGMPGIDGAREAVDLPETFVPLDISVNELHQQQGDKSGAPDTKTSDVTPVDALAYAVERSRLLLIIGEPGSGKTTIIKHFALSSEIRLPGFAFPLPILYMPLSQMAIQGSEQKSLPKNLAECFKPNLNISVSYFENRLSNQRCLVLLDGLDEISDSEQRKRVCIWIADAAKRWTKAFFVVTTRDKGYGENEQTVLRVDKLKAYVKRFSIEKQRDFLQKWFRAALLRDLCRDQKGCSQSRINEVKSVAAEQAGALDAFLSLPENEGMRKDLAGIPLLLQLMAILWKQSRAIPENREKLYSVALDYLLYYRENEKNIPPFLPATESKKLLEPVSLWMQDMNEDSADMEQFHDRMQKEVDILDYRYRSRYSAADICDNLVSRAGVLAISGSTYVFSHKTFREYLAGLQLVKSVTSETDRIENLVGQVGNEWWDEPLLFFAAQVDQFWFNKFMQAFFDSAKSDVLDQKTLNFLQKLIRRAPQTVDAFRDRLLHPDTVRDKRFYLLECLKTIGTRQAVETAQRFKTLSPLADTELLRKADEVIVTDEVAVPAVNAADLDQPGDGVGDEHPEVLFSTFEQNAQYILIRNGRHSVDGKEQVGDLYVAKYPVTNKLYRNFITYLQSADNAKADDILSDRLFKLAGTVPGFLKYLDEEPLLSKRCCSKYDDDRRFNEDDQPVVGVSWYDARAYCLWLSLIESKGTDPDRYRLPTDKEWEFAAAGKEGHKYPWSDEKGEPTSKLANYGQNVGATTPVGSYPEGATPEGLYDMAGNVWEWTDSWYDNDEDARSLRGGSWNDVPENLRCSVRGGGDPGGGGGNVGFRVVRSSHSLSS